MLFQEKCCGLLAWKLQGLCLKNESLCTCAKVGELGSEASGVASPLPSAILEHLLLPGSSVNQAHPLLGRDVLSTPQRPDIVYQRFLTNPLYNVCLSISSCFSKKL